MNKEEIKVNDCPVDFVLEFVTEPGEGWKGTQFLGWYQNTETLNQAINHWKGKCPLGWELKVSFMDKPLEGENS